MKLGALRTDVAAFDDGVWHVVVSGDDGVSDLRMKIRSTQSRAYQEAQAAEVRRAKDESRTKDLNDADVAEIQRRIVHNLITDWDGLEDDDGSPIGYSDSKCRELLRDRANVVLVDIIYKIANDIRRFREVTLANSKSES